MPEFYHVFESCNCHKQGNICWLLKNNLNLDSAVDYFCKHRILKHVLMYIYYKIGEHLDVSSNLLKWSYLLIHSSVCVCVRVRARAHTHTQLVFLRFFNAFCLSTP